MRAAVPPRPGLGWLLLGAMTGSLVAARIETGLLCLAVAVLAGTSAGMAFPARRWLALVGVGAGVAWTLNLFLIRGHPIPGLSLGPWPASREGAASGALYALRLVGAATALHGLRALWPGERAADEVARLARPLERVRAPVREARAMLGLALRFAPLLADEARRIARLQDLRAGRPPRGASEWLQRRRAATVPTLVHSLERAEQVALALEARHYRLRPVPSGAGPGARGWWGWAAAGAALAAVALVWRSR